MSRYYDSLPPAFPAEDGLREAVAGLRLAHRAVVSVCVPAGRIVVAFVSDSALLASMFAANWAPVPAGTEPDATLYALTRPAAGYGLPDRWNGVRWWSPEHKTMVVFGFGAYRLAKVCMRGICSAVSDDDLVFMHGCALSVGTGTGRRGVIITGGSGAGKTTLVAALLRQAGHPVAVVNDDWGSVSLSSGSSVSTGERMLHMKRSSVLALCPGFFTTTPARAYTRDLSESDRDARILVRPESVYGTAWIPAVTAITHVAVVLRGPPGWVRPSRTGGILSEFEGEDRGHPAHRHEAFFNGSLLLVTAADKLREEGRYRRLLDRVAITWVDNRDTPEALARDLLSAVTR